MNAVTFILGQRAMFIPHDGFAKAEPNPFPLHNKLTTKPTTQIQELVAVTYGLHPRYMKDKAKHRDISHPRQVAMYLTRKLTNRSLPRIGMAFGGRDHSTVVHAIRQVEKRMEENPAYREEVETLERVLRG